MFSSFLLFLLHYSNQFWVALLRLGASLCLLPPSHRGRGIKGLELVNPNVLLLELPPLLFPQGGRR